MPVAHSAPFTSVLDLLLDAVFMVDANGRIVSVSAACERIFGYPADEMLGKSMIDMVVAEDVAKTLAVAKEVMAGQSILHFENCYLRKDGRQVHIMWSARWSEADQLRIGVARDITELKQAQALQAALYSIAQAAHTSNDLLSLCQQVQQIIGQWLPTLGFYLALRDGQTNLLEFPYYLETDESTSTSFELPNRICTALVDGAQPLLLTPLTLGEVLGAQATRFAHGEFCWLGVPLYSAQDTIGALLLKGSCEAAGYSAKHVELLQFAASQLVTAIERQRLYARLQHMAQNDELTGLPNRTFLYDRLNVALAKVKRNDGRLCVIFLDLNKFKQVNDTYGHSVGDLLLQQVASRLRHTVRDEDSVARIGGDEFVVLLERIKQPETAALVCAKIRTALSQPMNLAGLNLSILPSIGIAHYPEHGEDVAQLLKYADEAMYRDKSSGML
ncbi:MAG: diguanylate cyclase [Pseudomonadaceae bacterium]|jgi:diguanylate cyclase (GGDEF)-like protein/PAS domain S-box-containing protein|nr:diguanylate cyclase [Pseudomonadaceae bacterium]